MMFDFVCLSFVLDSFEFVVVVAAVGCRAIVPYFGLVVSIVVEMEAVVAVVDVSKRRPLVVVACKLVVVFDSVVVIVDFVVVDFDWFVGSQRALVVDFVSALDWQA